MTSEASVAAASRACTWLCSSRGGGGRMGAVSGCGLAAGCGVGCSLRAYAGMLACTDFAGVGCMLDDAL